MLNYSTCLEIDGILANLNKSFRIRLNETTPDSEFWVAVFFNNIEKLKKLKEENNISTTGIKKGFSLAIQKENTDLVEYFIKEYGKNIRLVLKNKKSSKEVTDFALSYHLQKKLEKKLKKNKEIKLVVKI